MDFAGKLGAHRNALRGLMPVNPNQNKKRRVHSAKNPKGLSRKGRDDFIRGLSVGMRYAPRVWRAADKRWEGFAYPSDLERARVLYDFLMEQNYTPHDVKEHWERMWFKKPPLGLVGIAVARQTVLGEKMYLFKRTNRKQFVLVGEQTPAMDFRQMMVDHPDRFDDGERWYDTILPKPRETLHDLFRKRTRYTPVIGLVDHEEMYYGVVNYLIGFYELAGHALPEPVPDASWIRG